MYCHNCGKETDPQARFCPSCGENLQTTHVNHSVRREDISQPIDENYQANEWVETEKSAEDQALADFVGYHYHYYKDKWQMHDQPEKAISWNWAAFFLGIFWLGYRKMYQPIIIILGIYLAFDFLEIVTNYHPAASMLVKVVPYAAFALLGMYGNALYYRHARKQINKILPYDPDHQLLSRKGGTSGKGVFAAIGLLAVYGLIIFFLLLNAYSGTIIFGTTETSNGVGNIKSNFDVTEEIYYEVDFGEKANTTYVDIIVFYVDGSKELIYAEFQETISPDWTGFYNYLYDPYYDHLEPGKYIVRVYRDGQLLSEGEFGIRGSLF